MVDFLAANCYAAFLIFKSFSNDVFAEDVDADGNKMQSLTPAKVSKASQRVLLTRTNTVFVESTVA